MINLRVQSTNVFRPYPTLTRLSLSQEPKKRKLNKCYLINVQKRFLQHGRTTGSVGPVSSKPVHTFFQPTTVGVWDHFVSFPSPSRRRALLRWGVGRRVGPVVGTPVVIFVTGWTMSLPSGTLKGEHRVLDRTRLSRG